MNKRLLIILLIALGIILVVIAIYLKVTHRNNATPITASVSNKTLPKEIVKKDVEPSKTPDKFPSDIPIEKGAAITQNYNATAPDGKFQATRSFQSQASLAENLSLYKDYLTKAGYEIKSQLDQPNYKMVFGVKGNASIQVSIDQNSVSNIKTVNISYVEQPEKSQTSVSATANSNTSTK